MITIEKLIEDTDSALSKYFTKIVNGVKIKPEIHDHTDEVFICEDDEGVAVWCDVPRGALKSFEGAFNVIISVDADIVCISALLGDKCVDKKAAQNLSRNIDLGSWTVEEVDNHLMLSNDFSLTTNLEEELSMRFAEICSMDFETKASELLACFK